LARTRSLGGSRGWRIEWDTNGPLVGIALMEIRIKRYMHAHVVLWATIIESYMKISAPWTDDTGMARATLAAEGVRKDQNTYIIVLKHGVKYGKWLEIKNQNRFAIVRPTMHTHGTAAVSNLTGMLNRIQV